MKEHSIKETTEIEKVPGFILNESCEVNKQNKNYVKCISLSYEKNNCFINQIENNQIIEDKLSKSKKIKNLIRNEMLYLLKQCFYPNILQDLKFLSILFKLQDSQMFRNKRSIYYDSVDIFKSQEVTNSLIKKFTKKFDCKMSDLYIKSSLKGIFYGIIRFYKKDGTIEELKGKNLIPDISEIVKIENNIKKVLVIEKDTVFSHITDVSLIIICGKGYPCNNTIEFLKLFNEDTEIFCMTDFDPFGIHIFLVYKEKINRIKRIGIMSEDLIKYKINKMECIKLNKYDYLKIKSIRKKFAEKVNLFDNFKIKGDIRNSIDEGIISDLDFIEGFGFKLELEAIVINENFNILKYLNEKGIN